MSDNEHFIRSRSFSGWTHTLLVSGATASPWKRPRSGPADLEVDDLRRTSFCCETFSPEKGNARESAEACAK
jgi:hypothetical protein